MRLSVEHFEFMLDDLNERREREAELIREEGKRLKAQRQRSTL